MTIAIKYYIETVNKARVGMFQYKIDLRGWAFTDYDEIPEISIMYVDQNDYTITCYERLDVCTAFNLDDPFMCGFHLSLKTIINYNKLVLNFRDKTGGSQKQVTVLLSDKNLLAAFLQQVTKVIYLLKHEGMLFLLKKFVSKVRQIILKEDLYAIDNLGSVENLSSIIASIDLLKDTYVPPLNRALLESKPARLISFYGPWTAVDPRWAGLQSAKPQFEGHYQPHLPEGLGCYSSSDPAVLKRQIDLARLYGLEGFCFNFTWSAEQGPLEKHLESYLENAGLNFPFCLCWFNEAPATSKDTKKDDLAFIASLARYLKDPRYIRVDGKPLLVVYRPGLLPGAKKTAARWRKWSSENGLGEICLAYTQAIETVTPGKYGFDVAIEYPPFKPVLPDISAYVRPLDDHFSSRVYDWRIFVERSREYEKPDYPIFRGVCPSWDDSPGRSTDGNIYVLNSPQRYLEWLSNAIIDTAARFSKPEERIIFINAWNRWADGAHLEPDHRYGYACLEATRMALVRCKANDHQVAPAKERSIAVVIHAFYEEIFDEILGYLDKISAMPLKLYVTASAALHGSAEKKLSGQLHPYKLLAVNNRGRDILPFLKIMPAVLQGEHPYVIKIHTKKSPHRTDGDIWRRDVFDKLLTMSELKKLLAYFDRNPQIGILGPTGHIVPMRCYYGSNAPNVERLSARMGMEKEQLRYINFIAGSMFIARLEALEPLLNLAVGDEEFETETGQIDGTLAHAIERLFPISALARGFGTTCLTDSVTYRYKHV